MDELGSNRCKVNVTPPQCQVYRRLFGKKVPGQSKPTNPITHLAITGECDSENEFNRLSNMFGEKLINEVFPGENPNFPLTFAKAGFEETEQPEPNSGKKHDIPELQDLPKGDEGKDMEDGGGVEHPSIKELGELKQQVAQLQGTIGKLLDLIPKPAEPTKVEEEVTED